MKPKPIYIKQASEHAFDVDTLRSQFPALERKLNGQPVAYFDGPAGSQVPLQVADAVRDYLLTHNANCGGRYATSVETDSLLAEAREALADLVGSYDPLSIIFGPNMTTLTFALSRALARTWKVGDEVLVTQLDHDANVNPWLLAARDAGARCVQIGIHSADCTLDLDDLRAKLTDRTRLVAIGAASNATGSVNPIAHIAELVDQVGAELFVDAVHMAPHRLLDVTAWNCDYLVCSAYKFFGPHIGVLWGRRHRLDKLAAYKVRPVADATPGKWMTGTQNHEGIVGARSAVDYLADIGRLAQPQTNNRRAALVAALQAIENHEQALVGKLLSGLRSLPSIKVWGITQLERLDERVPTVSITHRRLTPEQLADHLGRRGIFACHGNFYALSLSEALGLEPNGLLRIGLLHYNTQEEVNRLLAELKELG